MDVGRLIECVRNYVYLYDIHHKDFKNPSLKSRTWDSIGLHLNESGETCRTKWKTVRDGYIKYKRSYRTSKTNNTYIWSSRLKFLDNYVSRKSFESRPYSIHDSDVPPGSEQLDILQEHTLSDTPPPLAPLTNYMEGSTILQGNTMDTQRSKTKFIDATDHLFLSYSETFKTFSLRQQALLKIELAKLFAHAELEQLNSAEESRLTYEDNNLSFIVKTEYNPQGSEADLSED